MLTDSAFHFALDCDEVLVNISNKWVDKCVNDPLIKEYILDTEANQLYKDDPVEFTKYLTSLTENALHRLDYYINDDLMLPPQSELFKRMMDVYYLDPTFYDDLPITPYTLSLYKIINKMSAIEKISIITHSGLDLNAPVNDSKRKFLIRLIKPIDKLVSIDTYLLPQNVPKSECINTNSIQYTTFVDDGLHNIEDVITKTDSKRKDFLIPLYGFNKDLSICGVSGAKNIVSTFGISDIYYFGNN